MTKSSLGTIKEAMNRFGSEGLSFLVGEPWFGPGNEILAGLEKAANQANLYSAPGGLPELKTKICQLEERRGLMIEPENIVIGNGSKSLLYGLMSLKGKGGIVTPSPAYPPMMVQPGLLGLPVETVSTLESDGQITPEGLRDTTTRDGLMVFSSPANPTGRVVNKAEMEGMLDWADSCNNFLVADEVYCDFVFDGKAGSLASVKGDFSDIAIVRSFSKSLGICGWRLGYIIADKTVTEALTKWQTVALNPPSTLVQKAICNVEVESLMGSKENRDYYFKLAKEIREIFKVAGVESLQPEGGFYLFLKMKKLMDKHGFSDSIQLCEFLSDKHGVALWPGDDFGAPGWARLAFGNIAPAGKGQLLRTLHERINKFM